MNNTTQNNLSTPVIQKHNVSANYNTRNKQAKIEESFDDLYNLGYDDIILMDDNEDIQRYISVNRIH